MIKILGVKFDINKILEDSLKIRKDKGIKAAVEYFSYETGWTKKDSRLYIMSEEFRKSYHKMINSM